MKLSTRYIKVKGKVSRHDKKSMIHRKKKWVSWTSSKLKMFAVCPDQVAQLIEAPSPTPKGYGFESQSGRIQEATYLSPPASTSLKINRKISFGEN